MADTLAAVAAEGEAMTEKEVLQLAKERGKGWTLGAEAKCLIRDQNMRCPLEVAANVPRGHYHGAADVLGLDLTKRYQVAKAADAVGLDDPIIRALRAEMVALFGLVENPNCLPPGAV